MRQSRADGADVELAKSEEAALLLFEPALGSIMGLWGLGLGLRLGTSSDILYCYSLGPGFMLASEVTGAQIVIRLTCLLCSLRHSRTVSRTVAPFSLKRT